MHEFQTSDGSVFQGKRLKRLRQVAAVAALAVCVVFGGGCKQQPSDADAIRAGITQHLTSLNTLNLSAMDMELNDVAIQGRQARAQVTFRPKTGAPSGAGMQVTYQLEKRDSGWIVIKTGAAGGTIEHPATSANPHMQPGSESLHGNLPNFREMIPSSSPSAAGTLPPGHPPIDASTQKSP
jgi:hypothetical protein